MEEGNKRGGAKYVLLCEAKLRGTYVPNGTVGNEVKIFKLCYCFAYDEDKLIMHQ